MAIDFTQPDPLRFGAKTLSIYITELQECVNTRRAEISQSPITSFINQRVGKSMRLDAIEQLKILVNQLAIDFGYSGGVTNSELLDRNYVEITKKFGKTVCHFPIINDLRQVLSLLELQVTVVRFVATDWYDNGASTVHPLANWDIGSNPWGSVPIDVQTGFGSTCPAGYPTCANTISGFFRGIILGVTDKSIIFNNIDGSTLGIFEGPIGGPYYQASKGGGGFTNITSRVFDADHYYYAGTRLGLTPLQIAIFRNKRDGSDIGSTEEVAVITRPSNTAAFEEDLLAISPNNIFIAARGDRQGPNLHYGPRFAIVTKAGVVSLQQDIPFQDLTSVGSTEIQRHWVGDRWVYQDGKFVGMYVETARIAVGANKKWIVASAVMTITEAGVITVSDIKQASVIYNLVDDASVRIRAGHGDWSGHPENFGDLGSILNGIQSGTSSGVFYVIDTPVAVVGSLPASDKKMTFNGSESFDMGTGTDYKGDLILSIGGSYDNVENWQNKGGGVTPNITPIEFLSTNRIEDTSILDKVEVSFDMKPGVFRVRLQRSTDQVVWITDSTIENTGQSTTIYADIEGLLRFNDYYVRIFTETGQGNRTDTVFVPKIRPNVPENLVGVQGVGTKADYTWDAPSAGEPVTGYKVQYRVLPATLFTEVDVGLVTNYSVLGLLVGDTVSLRVAAYNTKGTGSFTSEVQVTIV